VSSGTGRIQTVTGTILPEEFGFALIHEHLLCDFIGAAETGPHRWRVDEVVETMLPYLLQARERGVRGFVDCTPAFIGRDVRVLRALSERTGVHILTNTGYYGAAGDKFLPAHALAESPAELAARWISEWQEGIDGTGVRPGFIKIGVDPAAGDPPRLSEVDANLVRAAAIAHLETGLTAVSHTAQGAAALAQIALFEEAGAHPRGLIIAHTDAEPDPAWHREVATRGAWVSYDGIGRRPVEEHVELIRAMLDGHADRLLLSMDSGWYNAGEPEGGEIREYNALMDQLLPALRAAGVSDAEIRKLTVENPTRAFAVAVVEQ